MRLWVPEIKGMVNKDVHSPWTVGGVEGYPEPIVRMEMWKRQSVIAAAGLQNQRRGQRTVSEARLASHVSFGPGRPISAGKLAPNGTAQKPNSATHPRHHRRQRRCLEPKQEPPKLSPTSRNRKACSACDGTVKYVRNNVATRTVSNVTFSPRRMSAKCSSSARVPPATSPTSLASSWATSCNCCAQRMARNESMQTISTQVSIYPTRVMCI